MAQDTVTLPIRSTSATPGIEGTFAHMIERMKRIPPRKLNPFHQPDGEDLQDSADTIRIHIRAFHDYLSAFMRDRANASFHVNLDHVSIDCLLHDLEGECVGVLENAADRAREDEGKRAA